MKRTTAIPLVLAALGIALIASYLYDAQTPPPLNYTIADVRRGTVTQTVGVSGQISPLSSVEVSTQVSGLVTEVNVDFNSAVRRGQIVARIDSSTYEQKLLQARADLRASEVSHALTVSNEKRLNDLRALDLITRQQYDEAYTDLQRSEAVLLTRRAAVANAVVDRERCNITSPLDGIVIYRQIDPGRVVAASLSAPTLFVIARDLSKMQLIAPVSEVDIERISVSLSVEFLLDSHPGRTFTGRVSQIRTPYRPIEAGTSVQSSGANQNTFDVVIEIDNSDMLLRPGLTATAAIIVARRTNALLIPNSALRLSSTKALFESGQTTQLASNALVRRLLTKARGGPTEVVEIGVGISDSLVTEVLSGLKEGDVVVTSEPPQAEIPRGIFD